MKAKFNLGFKTLLLFFIAITSPLLASKKAIIIGASSGMGREVAKLLSQEGYTVGLVARRIELLESLKAGLPGPSFIKQINVTKPSAQALLLELIDEMGGVDLFIVSITAYLDVRPTSEEEAQLPQTWERKKQFLNVDFKGFITMADVAFDFFVAQNHGHFVGISSTSGLRGNANTPEYSAAKAGISTYMEAKRNFLIQNNIPVDVSNVVAGWVAVEHSPMGADPAAYWEISVQDAGQTIVSGIHAKSKIIYVPSKTRLPAFLIRNLPDFAYNKFFSWL